MRQRQALEQLVLRHIRDRRLIPAGSRVAIAVSGGADSVALFRILMSIRSELGVTVCMAHFDHGLRGPESDEDARFVAQLADAHGVELFAERADVAQEAARNGWNLEDAGRRLRYGFFRRLVERRHATHVAVAHTLDDQAETVLANIIRGTGPTGLAGIHPISDAILRPLLGFRRYQLREYLTAMGQDWREDPTNADCARLRSRIRLRLIPQLQQQFSSRIVEHLAILAQLSRDEELFWNELVETSYRALVHSTEDSAGRRLTISVAALLNPLPAITRQIGIQGADGTTISPSQRLLTERLIRRFYQELTGNCRRLTHVNIEQVIHLAARSTSGKKLSLPQSVRVQRDFENLIFSLNGKDVRPERPEENPGRLVYRYVVNLRKDELTRVPVREIGICFCLKTVDWGKTRSETTGEIQVLDIDSVQAPLILRNWLPGDAYTPRGRSRPRKLKELLLAARVPNGQRSRWPVLESAGRLIWARGMPAACEFSATERTRVGLVIEEQGIE